MEQADLIKQVRAECGKVTSSEELEDTDITTEVSFILKKIDDRVYSRKRRSITSEIDKDEYDVHADTVRVQIVYPSDAQSSDDLILGSHRAAEEDAEEEYLYPSLRAIKNMRRVAGAHRVHCEFDIKTRKLRIDPMPTQSGMKYWYISVEKVGWTLKDIPGSWEDVLLSGVVWRCLEIVQLRRSNLGGVMREGGGVDFPAIQMKPYVDQKRNEFFDSLRIKSMMYNI